MTEIKRNLTQRTTWLRLFIMLLFTIFYGVAEVVITAVVLFQAGSALLTGSPNQRLRIFGDQLAAYLYDTVRFLTFRSEVRPFPFAPWPEAKPLEQPPVKVEPEPRQQEPENKTEHEGDQENDGG